MATKPSRSSFGAVKKQRVTRALAGHFKKANVEPARYVREFRNDIDGVEAGQTISVAEFAPGDRVDVTGISKGHGFAGGIKRHNFSGGGASHGSMIHRQPASNGDTNAGRTVKGSRRPGHYGVDRTTYQNLEVVRADAERNLLLVRGPVPGSEERARDRAQERQVEGTRERNNAERYRRDRQSRSRSRDARKRSKAISARRCTRDLPRRLSANWPTRAPAPLRPRSATKSAAAVASRGSRRAPAARARVRSARRSGVTAAWSSVRSRAATSAISTRKSAASRSSPRSPTDSRAAP